MKLSVLAEKLGLTLLAGDPPEEFDGVYAGDFLSRAMSRVGEGEVWITIMNNVNVIAVASLTDAACVILAEDVGLDDAARAAADSKGVCVYSSGKTVYELCRDIAAIVS
ncbi:MAG: hypothetical protein IJO81_03725 [Clostridia bacterium]|nr:hypothetical protein [Clostridia bacterium]